MKKSNYRQVLTFHPNKDDFNESLSEIKKYILDFQNQRDILVTHFYNQISHLSAVEKPAALEGLLKSYEQTHQVSLIQEYGFDFSTISSWIKINNIKNPQYKKRLFFANGSVLKVSKATNTLTWFNNSPYYSLDILKFLSFIETYKIWSSKGAGAKLLTKSEGIPSIKTFGYKNPIYRKKFKNYQDF